LTESLVANALADLILNVDSSKDSSDQEMKKLGEDLMVNKINQILDEVAGET